MINRHTIYNIVANDLFPRIKFLNKEKDLNFSMEKGSVCHYVFHLGKLTYRKNQEAALWERAKKWIMRSIAKLRSDKCSAIRNAFYGKWYSIVLVLDNEFHIYVLSLNRMVGWNHTFRNYWWYRFNWDWVFLRFHIGWQKNVDSYYLFFDRFMPILEKKIISG